jgi:hypothetical protein
MHVRFVQQMQIFTLVVGAVSIENGNYQYIKVDRYPCILR